jgi:stearoyl-CoA desaturase (Delta-9 desaturase)
MPPRLEEFNPVIINDKKEEITPEQTNTIANGANVVKKEPEEIELPIVWRNVIIFVFLHLGALYGIYLCSYAKWETLTFAGILFVCGGLGITAGAHRLWAHRTYKAKLPLRILLCIFQTLALQNSIFEWCRDHRVHHKHAETNADPHNAKRGFFFSHMGWLLMKKHPDVFKKGSKIPMDDLLADPVVYYQKK